MDEDTGLTVSFSLEKVAVDNFIKFLDIKGDLIKKALGVTDFRIGVLEDKEKSFP